MKKCLVIVAVCLMSAPAMAAEVSQGSLSALGLSGLQVMSDADGMQVRGLSSHAAASGGSLVVGQLSYINDNGQNFIFGSDINTAKSSSKHYYSWSKATTVQGSAANGKLFVAPSWKSSGFYGTFGVFAGDASNAFGGRASAYAH